MGRVSKGTVDTANRQVRKNTRFPEPLRTVSLGSLRGFMLRRLKHGGKISLMSHNARVRAGTPKLEQTLVTSFGRHGRGSLKKPNVSQ